MKIKKINNEIVRPMHFPDDEEEDTRPITHRLLFDDLYPNIFLIARKHSGKTICASKIIRASASKNSTVIVICSTLFIDDNHKKIKKYCERNKIPYVGFTSMVEDGINVLETLLDHLNEKAEEELLRKEEDKNAVVCDPCLFNDSDDEEPKKRRPKYRSPEWILYFDDLSDELKNVSYLTLLKRNRHYKCLTITASQYCCDMKPEAHANCDCSLMYDNIPDEKIEKLYKGLSLKIPYDDFYSMYQHAIKEPYSFLYVAPHLGQFRKNFTHSYFE